MKNIKNYIALFILIHLMYSCKKDDEPLIDVAITASSVEIKSEKLNVFYLGVNNHIQVIATNIINDKIVKITGDKNTIEEVSENNYIVKVNELSDELKITVFDGETTIKEDLFRSKRIPNPFIILDNNISSSISSNQFKSFNNLSNFIFPNDFNLDYPDAKCNVISFTMTKIANRTDAIIVNNAGSIYTLATMQLVTQAKPGDFYLFTNIKVNCSGDQTNRNTNSLVYEIK